MSLLIFVALAIMGAVGVLLNINGLRQVEVSTSIAQDSLLEIGTDKFGQEQILVGIKPINGGTGEFLEITNDSWGNRKTIIPFYDDLSGFTKRFVPPLYQKVKPNSTTTIKARQTAVGAELEGAILFFMIAGPNGEYPPGVAEHIGEMHCQFGEGTSTAAAFPSPGASTATATENVLSERDDERWLPLMTWSIGNTPGQVKYSHPRDEGFPAMGDTTPATANGTHETFEPLPPSNELHGSDLLSFLAKSAAAAAVDMCLMTGRTTGGMKAISSYYPFSS